MRETLVKTEEFKDSPVGRIPKDWEVKTLGELGNFQNGLNKGKKDFGFGTKFVNILDVYPRRLNVSVLGRMNASQSELSSYQLEVGDILLDRSSVKLDGVGYPTVFEGADEPVIFCGFIIRFRLSTSAVKPRFLCELMRDEFFRNRIFQIATRSANVNVNQEQLAKLWVAFPPVPEQEQIIEILNTTDEAIARTSSLIAKLKQMKAGLLHDLLTRGLDENGELRDAIAHPEQFKDSPMGRIPKDWDTSILDKIISIIDCKHYTPKYVSDGIPIVRPRNIKVDGLDFSDIDYVLEKEYKLLTDKHLPRQGDIVFSRNASFGIPCYVDTTQRFAIGQDVVIMTELSANTRFVYYTLISDSTEKQIQNVSAGSTFGRINLACIRELVVPVPPREEQERIAQILNTYDTRIRTEEAYRDKLKLQKQGLMHDLLTGKVRVKNA